MNETIDCTNCCIADFKHSLCDCHGDFCTKYKSIGDENDFMQTVLADRPQGEWIVNISDYESICSVCGAKETEFIYGTEIWYGLGESKFCPNCGAQMKGADDETD